MNQADIIQQNQQEYLISGALNFSTVPALVQQSLGFFKANADAGNSAKIKVDLSQISSSNSAGLALMLEMVKDARLNNIELHFDNLPDTLLTIAKAYGVESEIRDICR